MRRLFSKLALTVALGLALAFTLSCGDHSLNDLLDDSSSSSRTASRSSSSGSNLVVSSSSSLARSSSGTSLLSSSGKNAIVYGKPITDSRDGQTYETVIINGQTWMAKNLNFQAEGAKCYGEGTRLFSADSIARNCEIYGRLYSWETAMDACPSGWHLPYYAEWKQLLDYVGTGDNKLRATDWSNGTDDYGFAALPSGGGWWSTANLRGAVTIDVAYDWGVTQSNQYEYKNLKRSNGTFSSMASLTSIRCVKD